MLLFILYSYPVNIGVGLESTSYKVAENFHKVEVCITLQGVTSGCAIGFPFSVNLSTIDGSAGIKLCMESNLSLFLMTVYSFYIQR